MKQIKTGTREQWLNERIKLLELEKEHTRRGDELSQMRQNLPWVKIDSSYKFMTEEGEVSLKDLFKGCSQLLVYHFMFGPDYKAGCPSCSSIADGFNGIYPHLLHHDVSFWAISLAPLPKLLEFRKRMGWSFPWVSAAGTNFNFDYAGSFTSAQQKSGEIEYNYRKEAPLSDNFKWRNGKVGGGESAEEKFAKMSGTDVLTYHRERPGMSAFYSKDDVIYHTYSAYGRGVDAIWSMYPWLDRAPLGRNENGPWWKHRDQY